MSAVELGDRELFAQFEEDASERAGVEDEERLRDTLETAARLKEENILIITRHFHHKRVQRNIAQ